MTKVFLGQNNSTAGESRVIFQIIEIDENGAYLKELVRAVGCTEQEFLLAIQSKETELAQFEIKKEEILTGFRFSQKATRVVEAPFTNEKVERTFLNALWTKLQTMYVTA
ncbi:MAG: hypothetical protein KBC22_00805 [Candidatus Pacebacteria bacterium]|nr:hypothetical protein [Candidatus Paceibacterota bacterium]